MNPIRKSILLALAVASMGSAALAVAQAPAPTQQAQGQAQAQQGRFGHAATQEQKQAHWAERAAKRQARLHDALKLSAAQEAAWATYQAAMKPAPAELAGARGLPGDRAAWASMPAPARMEKMIALMKQRTAMMEARLPALNAFYAVLTPEQKKVFDAHAHGRKGGRHGHHRGHGGHGAHQKGAGTAS